jgi:hypothetical protein
MERVLYLRSIGFTYLLHVTNKDNINILLKKYEENKLQKIGSLYERYLEKTNVNGVYSKSQLLFDENFEMNFTMSKYEYPALFMILSCLTIEEIKQKASRSKNLAYIIFPLELLCQNNWHFNLTDKNGIISYDTFFPHNITQSPSYQEVYDYYKSQNIYYIGNEVVFHNGIYLCNAIKIYCGENDYEYDFNHNLIIDYEVKPNYVYYSDRFYDGMVVYYFNPLYRDKHTTSDDFYINFIKEHLDEKYKYLCDNVSTKEELENRIYETKVNDIDLYTHLYISRFN